MQKFTEWLDIKLNENAEFMTLPQGVDPYYQEFFNSLNVVQKKRLWMMAQKYMQSFSETLPEALEYVMRVWQDKKSELNQKGYQYHPGVGADQQVKSWSTTRNGGMR